MEVRDKSFQSVARIRELARYNYLTPGFASLHPGLYAATRIRELKNDGISGEVRDGNVHGYRGVDLSVPMEIHHEISSDFEPFRSATIAIAWP